MPREYPTYTSNKTGKTQTLAEWSKETGIPAPTLFCRLKRGVDIDEAIEMTTAPKKKRTDEITDPVSGETHSVHEWASILSIDENTLYNRLFSYKWPVEKALYSEKFEKVNYKGRPKESYTHIDLTGQRFGHLTALRRADNDYVCMCKGKPKHEWKWLCQCDCGNTVEVIQHNLLNGHCTSCGCMNTNNPTYCNGMTYSDPSNYVTRDRTTPNNQLGLSNTPIYSTYCNMCRRCYSPDQQHYDRYGGNGIYICDEWLGPNGFINFYNWSMANGYSEELTIDRIDNNGPYAPWNCRWVTMEVQCNNKSNNIYITYNGVTQTAAQWANQLGIDYDPLRLRYHKGLAPHEILELPPIEAVTFIDDVDGNVNNGGGSTASN